MIVGDCIDSGVEMSVIILNQAKAYAHLTGRTIASNPHPITLKNDEERVTRGLFGVRIPFPNGIHIGLTFHIVQSDIPFLIVIEIHQKENIILDIGTRRILNDGQGW